MKLAFVLLILLASRFCQADAVGKILWEPGLDPRALAGTEGGRIRLLPNAPLDGQAQKDAVRMGVIDSGVLVRHPQLAGYLAATRDFTGEGDTDVLGHGTAVALIAVFSTGTPSPSAILSAKVVSRDGKIQKSRVIEAVHWVAAEGARVVNLSLGFPGDEAEHRDLCNVLSGYRDILFVAAAGNDGPDKKMFPAACDVPNVMAVAASDEKGQLAAYSGKGAIMAPGQFAFVDEWRFYYEQGQKQVRAGRLAEARGLYERSLQAEPNAESAYQLGLIDLAERRVDASLTRFRQAIRIEPALAEAHEMLGAALFQSGDFAAAIKSLRTAIDLYPELAATVPLRARAHFNLGQALLRLDMKAEAKDAFEQVKSLLPSYRNINEALKAASS